MHCLHLSSNQLFWPVEQAVNTALTDHRIKLICWTGEMTVVCVFIQQKCSNINMRLALFLSPFWSPPKRNIRLFSSLMLHSVHQIDLWMCLFAGPELARTEHSLQEYSTEVIYSADQDSREDDATVSSDREKKKDTVVHHPSGFSLVCAHLKLLEAQSGFTWHHGPG